MNPKHLFHVLFVIFLFVQPTLFAQKKNFTLAEAVTGMSSKFALKNLKQLQWAGVDDEYSYVVNSDSEKAIYLVNPINFSSKVIATLAQLNDAAGNLLPAKLKSIPAISFKSRSVFYLQDQGKLIEFQSELNGLKASLVATLPTSADAVSVDTNKMSVAYVNEHNLWVNYREGTPMKVSKDGSKDIVYGQSVHRDEFGIDRGIFWSPSGNFLAFYRMDQSMVEDYPVVDWNETPAKTKLVKYPFAGRSSHHVTLGVFDCATARTIYLNTGEPKDQYLTSVTWSPDEKFIYVALLNRDQNELKLIRYVAATGMPDKTILEERNAKYVEPKHPLYFPTADPNRFIWWSQRDGYTHLYDYVNDQLSKQLTSGEWVVNEILGYNPRTQELVITAAKESPLQKNVYAVNLNSSALRPLSSINGTHTAQLSHSGTYLIDQFTNRDIPRAIEVNNIVNKQEKRILSAMNTLDEYNTARVELVELKANDGTILYGKLIYPTDFDSSKRYPTLVYLYNGPGIQLNKESFPFSGNLWYDYMAQRGYVVFVVDGRGSANRGFKFESSIHRQLGSIEMEDQLKGVNYLKGLPFVDANRMGVHGWSYGGFMTTSLMLRQPGVFKCGVAGGPVLDWGLYEVMYTERYMDTPQQNPEGYKSNQLFDKVKNLQGKLLMIHGTDDDVVVWQHSLRFIKKCVDEGVQVDYFVYPGHPHNVRGKDRVHLMQKITDYFDTHLK